MARAPAPSDGAERPTNEGPRCRRSAKARSLAFGSQEGLCKRQAFDDNLLLHLDRHVHAVIIRAVDTPYRHTSRHHMAPGDGLAHTRVTPGRSHILSPRMPMHSAAPQPNASSPHTHAPPWRSKCATVHRHALHTHNPCTTLDSQNRSRRITDRRQKKEERIRRSSPGCVSTLLWWSLSLFYAGGSPLTSSSIDWRLPPSMSLAFCCCNMSISSSSAVQIAANGGRFVAS